MQYTSLVWYNNVTVLATRVLSLLIMAVFHHISLVQHYNCPGVTMDRVTQCATTTPPNYSSTTLQLYHTIALTQFTTQQLHHTTAPPHYSSTTLQLHHTTAPPNYSSTTLQLHHTTAPPHYKSTTIQLHHTTDPPNYTILHLHHNSVARAARHYPG